MVHRKKAKRKKERKKEGKKERKKEKKNERKEKGKKKRKKRTVQKARFQQKCWYDCVICARSVHNSFPFSKEIQTILFFFFY